MATDHHNQVSTRALLRKRALSGQGLARCSHRHGARLWHLCRWQPARTLVATARRVLTVRRSRCALPPRLRLLALARAAEVLAVYAATRLHQLALLGPGRRDVHAPLLGRDVRCCLQLRETVRAPAE